MKIQHAAVIASATPYIKLLKFTEDIGETITLPFASPVALSCAAFSPDGKALIAAASASTTASLRMWTRPSTLSDVWTEGPALTALPSAKTVYDLAWINDTEFAIVANAQVWVVTVDRATGALTYTSLDTADRGTYRRLTVSRNRRCFFVSNGKWNTSAAGLASYYWNGSAWTAWSNGNYSSYVSTVVPFADDGMLAHVSTGAMLRGFKFTPEASPPAVVANSMLQVTTTDAVAYDGVTAGVWNARIGVAPDDQLALIPMFTTPWVTPRRILNFKTPAYWSDPAGPTFPTIAAQINDIMGMVGGFFLLALNSATITTGRVRGWRYSGPEANLTEIDAISDMFDSWNATPSYIAAGPVVTGTDAVASLYDSAIPALTQDNVDLTALKLLLLDDTAVFNAANTTLATAVGVHEVTGSNWPSGGIDTDTASYGTTGGVTSLVVNIPALELNDPGTLNFRYGIIYDGAHTDDRPLMFLDFGEAKSATQFDRMTFAGVDGRLIDFTPTEAP